MLSSLCGKIIFTIIGVVMVIAGTVLTERSSAAGAKIRFLNNQVLYAETASTATSEATTTSSTAESVAVPILVYHIVRPAYSSDSAAVRALAQTPEIFDAQMQYLADAGYHITTFNALEAYFRNDTPLPTNPVIISFDDGWSDQFTYAFPILQKYHYPATFFVFTNPIGHRGFLSWNNLRIMHDAGMTIGSHTRSHPFLTKISSPAILWNEIDGSKKIIEQNLGITVHEFAYPFGQYDPSVIGLVQKAGYALARGDYPRKGGWVTSEQLYTLGALNAPTTTATFMLDFPKH